MKGTFVLVICGDIHAKRANISLQFLRKFSDHNIIIVKCRTAVAVSIEGAKEILVDVAEDYDNHQASIFLKTSLHRICNEPGGIYCYLDTDVIAVNRGVSEIFACYQAPVSFATDHVPFSIFSRHAVHCQCTKGECRHLHEAVERKFGINISDKAWQHWNGGVFLFGAESHPFMEQWHAYTLEIFKDVYWKCRDQGTLAALAWKLDLQSHPTLPRRFNFILDATASHKDKGGWSLCTNKKDEASFLHLINGGIAKRGWKVWEEAKKLVEATAPAPAVQAEELSPDNRVVHGLWIGNRLSQLELLTIQSFLRHGHEFHLWLYGDLETALPREVILEDATKIIPKESIFRKRDTDAETGVGKGSFGSPFSDLFRYKLLYEKGGYWVDMDITCLHPLSFADPYVFRSHRVGVVGNLMKCPAGSPLMKAVYEKVLQLADENSEWLMPNRELTRLIKKLHLMRYVRKDICNEDSWWQVIKPLIEGESGIPSEWYVIHWINEFWRTLAENKGVYRGKKILHYIPDKDRPREGSTLARLYVEHGLAKPGKASQESPCPVIHCQSSIASIRLNQPAEPQPHSPCFFDKLHINVLLPSLARGGAERSVLETVAGLDSEEGTSTLFLLHETSPAYEAPATPRVRVVRLGALQPAAKFRVIAAEVFSSPHQVLYTHLVKVELLKELWKLGVTTIPVIQNARPGWQDSPVHFRGAQVPFVAAVSEAVGTELRAAGCVSPVRVVRHELQRWPLAETMAARRREIRDRHAIPENCLLLGMVGEFKSQKAYTRAVRVLHALQQKVPAKLMILGGWDHAWGYGRATYTATCRLAVQLGVIPDLLPLGPVPNAEDYYPAFDVFLSTSVYEGLSVALLEAIRADCPIVTADAGGNREVLPPSAHLVTDVTRPNAYVSAILKARMRSARNIVTRPADAALVPVLWSLLSAYGLEAGWAPEAEREGVLFITDNLNIGGAPRSLLNLLASLPATPRPWLCVLHKIYCQDYLVEAERTGSPVISLYDANDYIERVRRLLALLHRKKFRTLCFWNADARVKLLLAKILPPRAITMVDVSPGPWYYVELENTSIFQQRITLSATDYFSRVDWFVAKYADGLQLPEHLRSKGLVIPNGVPLPQQGETEPPAWLTSDIHPDLIIGTCSRIIPGKRIEYLLDMMSSLNSRLAGVTLVIVGGVDPRYEAYWKAITARVSELRLTNVIFTGPDADVARHIRHFKVFVMISERHGCPNASLEAMVRSVPVVANASGGTAEQVISGKTGFLVSEDDPVEAAMRVRFLLTNPAEHHTMGEAARQHATESFSMAKMAQAYDQILQPR